MLAQPPDPDPGSEGDDDMTVPAHISSWESFCIYYYDRIERAMMRWVPIDQAKDLTHNFLLKAQANRFIENYPGFAAAQRARKRSSLFRSYLYTSLRNFAIDHHRAGQRRPKMVDLGDYSDEVAAANPDALLDQDAVYALDVLHQALQALRHHCEQIGKPHIWTCFEETYLASEILGRIPLTRAELIQTLGLRDAAALDNALVTARRAMERIIHEVLPRWPSEDLAPDARFKDWMDTLAASNASQFRLLEAAFRVTPVVGAADHDLSQYMIADHEPTPTPPPRHDAPIELDADATAILLSLRLEVPLDRMLDHGVLRPLISSDNPFRPRSSLEARRLRRPGAQIDRPLCLMTLVEPTPAEERALAGVQLVELLRLLKDAAKSLHLPRQSFPRVISEAVYTVACVLARVHARTVIYSIGDAGLARNIRCLLAAPWLDDRLRPLLRRGLDDLEAGDRPRLHSER